MNNQVSPKILKEIATVTEALTQRFSGGARTNLEAICEDEGLRIISADYGQYFDGMLVWGNGKFHIHLNIKKGNNLNSGRGRFTLSHELGHYFLETHRTGIRAGTIPAHASNTSLFHDDKLESEADCFAANLLMPRERVRRITGGKKFSLDVVRDLAEKCAVSLTSALLRFTDVGTHEVMIVYSQGNIIKWSHRSSDFPRVSNKFRRGDPLPPTSVAGESFLKENAQYTDAQPIDFDDWYSDKGYVLERPLYEQCLYSDIYNCVISVIWFT